MNMIVLAIQSVASTVALQKNIGLLKDHINKNVLDVLCPVEIITQKK